MGSLTEYADRLWGLINEACEDGFSVLLEDSDLILIDDIDGRRAYFGAVSND